jgi:hypothetical protein
MNYDLGHSAIVGTKFYQCKLILLHAHECTWHFSTPLRRKHTVTAYFLENGAHFGVQYTQFATGVFVDAVGLINCAIIGNDQIQASNGLNSHRMVIPGVISEHVKSAFENLHVILLGTFTNATVTNVALV